MATYDNLPVYKACYSLLLMLFNGARHMQLDYRFVSGDFTALQGVRYQKEGFA